MAALTQIVPLAIDQDGKYMLTVVAQDEQGIGIRLWQVIESERELLSEVPDTNWHPFLSFRTNSGASLEAEMFCASSDVDFELHLHRAVLRSDTDLDDTVSFPDLFNVIMDFGEVCDEGVACASDVDDDGTVQVREPADGAAGLWRQLAAFNIAIQGMDMGPGHHDDGGAHGTVCLGRQLGTARNGCSGTECTASGGSCAVLLRQHHQLAC